VSGDGPNNDGRPLSDAIKEVMMQKIIINGLPIMDENANGYYPNLDKYFAGCVVGGTGAFVVVVRSFKDFGAAMRRKLILEISSGRDPDQAGRERASHASRRSSKFRRARTASGRTEIIRPTPERVLGAVRPQRLRLRRLLRSANSEGERANRFIRASARQHERQLRRLEVVDRARRQVRQPPSTPPPAVIRGLTNAVCAAHPSIETTR
jgi:hypothetical protein